ncbi:MAG: hypothetical protein AB7O96_18910 [Pseudobdellovibrionaceae bacterium]
MEKKFLKFLILIIAMVAMMGVTNSRAHAEGSEYRGYTSDIRSEKKERFYEVFLLLAPRAPQDQMLKDRIFDSKLSKEFVDRYDRKFGSSNSERLIKNPEHFEFYDTRQGLYIDAQEYTEQQRSFGEYMIRRLTEYHLDNYAKSKPEVRPVYDLKEKLSKVEVKVAPGVSLDAKYSVSGNFIDLKLANSYVDTRVIHEFSASTYEKPETRLVMTYTFSPKTQFEATLLGADGIASLTAKRSLTKTASGSLTASTYTYRGGYTEREHRVAGGIGWNFY